MKPVSNYLKGVAITTVLVNHYLNLNVAGNFSGYSNLFIGAFFFQSGYATWYSLQNNMKTIGYKPLFFFFYNRSLRIFPLLWCAWSLEYCIRKGDLSLWIPTGIHAEGHYWFIPALFQCYALAPLLYFGLKKKMQKTIAVSLASFLIVNLLFALDVLPALFNLGLNFINAKWRGLYFLHILLFLIGLATSCGLQKYQPKVIRLHKTTALFLFWAIFLSVLGGMILIRHLSSHNTFYHTIFLLAPVFPLVFICIYAFLNKIENRLFSFIGSISYAIYLFHMSFYLVVGKIGSFPKNSFMELVITLMLTPVFFAGCIYIERFGGYIYRRLKIS